MCAILNMQRLRAYRRAGVTPPWRIGNACVTPFLAERLFQYAVVVFVSPQLPVMYPKHANWASHSFAVQFFVAGWLALLGVHVRRDDGGEWKWVVTSVNT